MRTAGVNDAELARRAAEGDGDAFAVLFDRWFDRVYDVAWHIVRHRDTAADVAQDTFVAAWRTIGGLRSPESFGGWLLRISRNHALNRLRRERRSIPVGDDATMEALDPRVASREVPDMIGDRERDDLVWVASVALGEADASLLSLHLRHGLDPSELADALGVKPNAAHQRLHRLRQRLGDAIAAWMLWARGAPACAELRAMLAATSGGGFDAATASAISAHGRTCDECRSRRDLLLAPEALFSAIPLLAAPAQLRDQVVASLRAQDVPVDHRGAKVPGRALAAVAAVVVVVAALAVGGAVALRDGDDEPAVSAAATSDAPAPTGSAPTTPPTARTEASTDETKTTVAPTTTDTTAATTTTTSTTSTTAPPSPPVVTGFTAAADAGGPCSGPRQVAVVFTWSSDATSATLGPAGAAAQDVEPSGTASRCAIQQSTWVLTVTGPGGTTTASAAVP